MALFAILTQPMNEEMLRRAWTEPLLFLTMAFCLWTLTTRSHLLRIVGIAALISAKQYAVLALPVLWLCAGVTLVEIAGACAVALALVLPWLVNDPVGVWRGCVVFHIENTFRIDATAVPAWMLYRLGIRIPTSLAFVVVALTFAWIARRRPTGLAQATLALVAVLLGFFVWNKAAFLNYYWFTATLLLTTIPLAVAETSQKCDNVR